jgi:hypothetical protein
MTDEELRELVTSVIILQKELAVAQKETDKQFKETDKQFKETDKQFKETDKQFKETDKRIKELAEEIAIAQKETDNQFKETSKQIKELGKQIGGLSNKFGSFTEGMAFPSMEKILREHFGMTIVAPNLRAKRNGQSFELDVFAYSNGENKTVCIVEVKSHLREENLQQMLDILRNFPLFFPDHADKKLYGILAAVDISDNVKNKILESGIYVARIHDENFKLQVPKNFKVRNFQFQAAPSV